MVVYDDSVPLARSNASDPPVSARPLTELWTVVKRPPDGPLGAGAGNGAWEKLETTPSALTTWQVSTAN